MSRVYLVTSHCKRFTRRSQHGIIDQCDKLNNIVVVVGVDGGISIGKLGLNRIVWSVDMLETSRGKLSRETVRLSVTCHHMGVVRC